MFFPGNAVVPPQDDIHMGRPANEVPAAFHCKAAAELRPFNAYQPPRYRVRFVLVLVKAYGFLLVLLHGGRGGNCPAHSILQGNVPGLRLHHLGLHRVAPCCRLLLRGVHRHGDWLGHRRVITAVIFGIRHGSLLLPASCRCAMGA